MESSAMNFIKLTSAWKGEGGERHIWVNLNQVVQIRHSLDSRSYGPGSILHTMQPPYVEHGDAEICVLETPEQIMKSLGIITL